MNYKKLGKTGLKVSRICLGAMNYGDPVSETESISIVKNAIAMGVNFFDTADVYSQGRAEEIFGKAIGTRRKEIILATKVRGRMGQGPNEIGLSRHHILEGCNASLKRLGTDYIDLYQVHSFDPHTPLEETLRALDDLVRQGKVRYIGCSNYTGWQLMKALAISEKHNWEKFVTLQAFYSLMARDLENELVPLCLDQGLGILTWSPLGGGFLSGKYRRGKPRPEGTRRSNPEGQFLQFDEGKGFDLVDQLDKIAHEHNATVAQAALNYLLRKPGVTSVIIGAKTREQLSDNLKTTDWEMNPEEVLQLEALSPPPRAYPYWMLERMREDR